MQCEAADLTRLTLAKTGAGMMTCTCAMCATGAHGPKAKKVGGI